MTKELEIAGAASLGGWLGWRRRHADIPPGTPCANCATPLQGAYCHVCGQLAEDFHKSIFVLIVESIESLLHFDGRLWRTLPRLVGRPGRLTREYLDGKRAPQIPPFRLFLVVLLVAFFAGHFASSQRDKPERGPTIALEAPTVGGATAAARQAVEADPALTPEQKRDKLARLSEAQAELEAAGAADLGLTRPVGVSDDAQHWIETRAKAIQEDPERFFLLLEIWGHRVAVLMLPLSALFLTLLFVFQRRFYVFDHLVFSMHSLSFQLLLLTTVMLSALVVGPAAAWLLLASPAHLFMHLRGVYSTGVFGTLVRMTLLFGLTVLGFTALAGLWVYLGVRAMGGH